MGTYGEFYYGDDLYGAKQLPRKLYQRAYKRIILGFNVRRSIAKKTIYRVRRDNGLQFPDKRIVHQDKYPYFLPPGYDTANAGPARDNFRQAVINWKTVLTDEEKQTYNKRARKGMHMSGINLYIKEYMTG
jgi:hypothetical protein